MESHYYTALSSINREREALIRRVSLRMGVPNVEELRETDPVHWLSYEQGWADAVSFLLADPSGCSLEHLDHDRMYVLEVEAEVSVGHPERRSAHLAPADATKDD